MRTHLVEVLPPRFDHHLRLCSRTEPLDAEAFVAEFAVEAFADAILPGLAGVDQGGADAVLGDPLQQRTRHELGAVVGTQEGWRTALADHSRQDLDHPAGADAGTDIDRETLAGELVRQGQALQSLTVGTVVEHEVVAPDLVRRRWRLWPRPRCRHAFAPSLARHLQFRQSPQPISAPRAHRMPVPGQENLNAPIAIARILCRQRRHLLDHRSVADRLSAEVTER